MSGITTHVLDVSIGKSGPGIDVVLERQTPSGEWERVGTQKTDEDGRARGLLADTSELKKGGYRLSFDIGAYFDRRNVDAFYREIAIEFVVNDVSQHYHVPLLVSPFGYSTYRGS